MNGARLTTHVLDAARGVPAGGVVVIVLHSDGDEPLVEVARAMTNADGRTDAPLLEDEGFGPGVYELRYDIGSYFTAHPLDPSAPAGVPLFDEVPVRVNVATDTGNLHVALLVTPWSYTTYRGS
ncbi:MAG: 5-hydroxyisourate hydrolase [Actinomycetia bacterium]|nr:5-hydroxyisourate hydrolase [Actinomycetes bacterium]